MRGRNPADAIAQVRALRFDLSDDTELHDTAAETAGDRSFIHALGKQMEDSRSRSGEAAATIVRLADPSTPYWNFETEVELQFGARLRVRFQQG